MIELRGCRQAISCVYRPQQLWIEGDSKLMVDWIDGLSDPPWVASVILSHIWQELRKFPNWRISHVWREVLKERSGPRY